MGCVLCVIPSGNYDSNVVESVEVHNPITKNTIIEKVFACWGKTSTTAMADATKYLISKEYNVSDIPRQYIAGRFVFIMEKNKVIRYEALAEESAKVVKGKNVEKMYFEIRKDRKPGD